MATIEDLLEEDKENPELKDLIAYESSIKFKASEDEDDILEEQNDNILKERKDNIQNETVVLLTNPREVKVNLYPLKERVHFEKTKESKKRYKHMGSNE